MNKDEALRLALEALGHFEKAGLATLKTIDAITAIKQALEETQGVSPEPDPVAWMNPYGGVIHKRMTGHEKKHYTIPLYTSPPKREPLTDEDIFALENSVPDAVVSDRDWCIYFARAIEAAHGIKGAQHG